MFQASMFLNQSLGVLEFFCQVLCQLAQVGSVTTFKGIA
jgi:hypothetical protein